MSVHVMTERPRNGGGLATAVAEVQAALSSSAESNRHRHRILAFVATHDDALLRSCHDGHLTGSALVVDDRRERVLLMLHAKLGMWLQPGGHADGEGNLAAVALTEAEEETGVAGLRVVTPALDCDVHVIPARGAEPQHLHLDVRYLVLAPPDAEPSGNHESHELRWCSLDDLDDLATDDSLRRLAHLGLDVARRLA